ncbi:hypothetical protein GEMRC1_006572 [Eukaryota sp. GEM-RC1]
MILYLLTKIILGHLNQVLDLLVKALLVQKSSRKTVRRRQKVEESDSDDSDMGTVVCDKGSKKKDDDVIPDFVNLAKAAEQEGIQEWISSGQDRSERKMKSKGKSKQMLLQSPRDSMSPKGVQNGAVVQEMRRIQRIMIEQRHQISNLIGLVDLLVGELRIAGVDVANSKEILSAADNCDYPLGVGSKLELPR